MAQHIEVGVIDGGSSRSIAPGTVPPDATIARFADRQRRVVGRWQLLGAQVPADVIDRRVRAGRLFVVHRGVYAVGTPQLEWEGRVWAAVLAGGPGAVACRRTAAELWRLRDGGRRVLDVAVPRTRHRVAGVAVFRARDLRPEDVTACDGIPATTVARTLLDRAARATRAELRWEIGQARQRGILDEAALVTQLDRHRGYAGAAVLRSLVGTLGDRTDSELEDLMLAGIRRAGLPEPEVNYALDVGGRRIRTDFRWPGLRVVVEVDGGAFHLDREADYARDLDLRLAGWDVLRFTWDQVNLDLGKVLAGLRLALAC